MNLQRILHYLERANEAGYIGESVSQLEHALQCAYFAEKQGHDESVILASLLHDIGHFAHETPQMTMADLGVVYHEWIGAKFAYEAGLTAKIAWLIGCHVEAKRYLAAKKPVYQQRLSSASQGTLVFQGGPMTAAECTAFESFPYFKEILQVRINDEKAKEVNLSVPSLSYYIPMLERYLHTNINDRLAIQAYEPPYDKSFADKLKFSLLALFSIQPQANENAKQADTH